MDQRKICATCAHCVRVAGANECHRYPPTLITVETPAADGSLMILRRVMALSPPIETADVCGEWLSESCK